MSKFRHTSGRMSLCIIAVVLLWFAGSAWAEPATTRLASPVALPNFDIVTSLEAAPRPSTAKPARKGRVFDGAITREAAVAAWRGGSLVAVYDYGINCSLTDQPSCTELGVETVPDVSGFSDERTVANPADPTFLGHFSRRIGAAFANLRPRPGRDLLAAHLDNLGLLNDLTTITAIYDTARREFHKRGLRPLFVGKNNMRAHEALLASGSLRPEELVYFVCENCLTKANGAELESGLRLSTRYNRPIVLIEFGKAKLSWQDATPDHVAELAQRLKLQSLRGVALWGPDENRYEFTRSFHGASDQDAATRR